MSQFTNFNGYKRLAGSRTKYVLTEQFRYELGRKGSGEWVAIPVGETFDISVPKCLEWLQDPHDREVLLAALVHDWIGLGK